MLTQFKVTFPEGNFIYVFGKKVEKDRVIWIDTESEEALRNTGLQVFSGGQDDSGVLKHFIKIDQDSEILIEEPDIDGEEDTVMFNVKTGRQIALGAERQSLFTQVVRLAGTEIALVGVMHLAGNGRGVGPVARALVDGQQRQAGLGLEGGVFQAVQCIFRTVQQTGFQKVQRQGVLGALAVGTAEVPA